MRVLSGKLRATRKQLCREGQEKTSLQTLLKQKDKEELKFHELVGKKNKEVHVMQQQNQQVTRTRVFVLVVLKDHRWFIQRFQFDRVYTLDYH